MAEGFAMGVAFVFALPLTIMLLSDVVKRIKCWKNDTCPQCNGSGTTFFVIYRDTCGRCKGTGKFKRG